jgi:hypothetical protein
MLRHRESRTKPDKHSAAGCNPKGGLITCTEVAPGLAPAGLAFIDTCFDTDVATRFWVNLSETKVWVFWQNITWHRDPGRFISAIPRADSEAVRLVEFQPTTSNPHVDVMYSSVETLVREWLTKIATQPSEQQHHKAAPSPTEPSTPPTAED